MSLQYFLLSNTKTRDTFYVAAVEFLSRGTRKNECKKAFLNLESSTQRHLSLQRAAITLKNNMDTQLQLQAHQKQKCHLHSIYFFAAHAYYYRLIRIPVIPQNPVQI